MNEQMILPDGQKLTEARKKILEAGYDHYWRFHDKPDDWAGWCPVCRMKTKDVLVMQVFEH